MQKLLDITIVDSLKSYCKEKRLLEWKIFYNFMKRETARDKKERK